MRNKKSNEEFILEVYNLVQDDYTVLGVYSGAMKNLLMRHNNKTCNNHQYEVRPNNFLCGKRCPSCAGKISHTTDEFKEMIFDIVESEYSLIGEYSKTYIKVFLKHNTCGHEWKVLPFSFLNGSRCPNCMGGVVKTHEVFEKEFYRIANDEYLLLGEYKNSSTKIDCKHLICGNVYKMSPSGFLNGHGCPICSGRQKIDGEIIRAFESKGFSPMFQSEDYKNNSSKLPFICTLHIDEGVQHVSYAHLLRGQGCRCCSRLKMSGENCHLWRGGITPENLMVRYSLEYKKWRSDVFIRDYHTCQCCGDSTSGDLQAHHIENFSDIKDKRLDIDNGITLCVRCHDPKIKNSFHSIYGTRNNSREQLIEYIYNVKNKLYCYDKIE